MYPNPKNSCFKNSTPPPKKNHFKSIPPTPPQTNLFSPSPHACTENINISKQVFILIIHFQNKEINMEIARTWAEKRTMLKNISKVGTFVRKSMQELCHDEVLLALEARVQNCRGLAQASAKGLRMIMETTTFGNHFMTFEEAFHLYLLLLLLLLTSYVA